MSRSAEALDNVIRKADTSLRPLTEEEASKMIDLREAEIVGVQVSEAPDGSLTLWVCVDGVCRLRVTKVKKVEMA
jgi:hypothetical protein